MICPSRKMRAQTLLGSAHPHSARRIKRRGAYGYFLKVVSIFVLMITSSTRTRGLRTFWKTGVICGAVLSGSPSSYCRSFPYKLTARGSDRRPQGSRQPNYLAGARVLCRCVALAPCRRRRGSCFACAVTADGGRVVVSFAAGVWDWSRRGGVLGRCPGNRS